MMQKPDDLNNPNVKRDDIPTNQSNDQQFSCGETQADGVESDDSAAEDDATHIQSLLAGGEDDGDVELIQNTSATEVRNYSEATTDPIQAAETSFETDDGFVKPADDANESVKQRLLELKIVGDLGRGGMGQVFRVFDKRYNREVALKRLSTTGAHRLKLFKSEFRELADISHPNLATLYELLSDGSSWYLTMELVEGVELGRYVMHGHTQEAINTRVNSATTEEQFDRIREALPSLIRGLNALHSDQKFHRDIKANNVMVRPDGQLKLLDFGLVSNAEVEIQEAANRSIQGTIPFISPEQVAGQPASAASN